MKGAERLPDHDEVLPVAGRVEHRLRVLGQPGRVVLARQIRGDRVGTAGAQLGLDEMPIPTDITGAVDQNEGGHWLVNRQGCLGAELGACVATRSTRR